MTISDTPANETVSGEWTGHEPSLAPRFVGPRLGDARLHTAGVIMTVHVLGQVALDFAVSVPQILSAILTAASIEIVLTHRRSRQIVWPASAMLTGSGVGLIMRAIGTEPGDHWTFHRWYLFSAVAGISLLTKYAIRTRNGHVFNPSNVGLVAAFLLLGSSRIEPLAFWWHPLDPGMIVAYVVIIVGGTIITARLSLVAMAVTCWTALVTGLAVQARAGHCVWVPWQDPAACDFQLWRVIAASPEVLVFLFFMLTDPRTVPTGARQRVVFAAATGALAALLIAPQRTEFGAKVALLGALTIVTAARPLLVGVRSRLEWLAHGRPHPELVGVLLGVSLPVLGTGWIAGQHLLADRAVERYVPDLAAAELPAADLPGWAPTPLTAPITVDDRALAYDPSLARESVASALIDDALRALEGERRAVIAGDAEWLTAFSHGHRLAELGQRIRLGHPIEVAMLDPTDVTITLVRPPGQGSPLAALIATGTVTITRHGPDATIIDQRSRSGTWTIAIRRADDGRLLIADVAGDEH